MIKIKETKNADTRSAKKLEALTREILSAETKYHREAVRSVLRHCSIILSNRMAEHDLTKFDIDEMNKLTISEDFYNAIKSGKQGKDFYELDWWKRHVKEERHHELDNRGDVNLVDVIEMVVDCVCAGLARTGTIFPIKLKPETLQRAVDNTVELLKKEIEVEKEDESIKQRKEVNENEN